MTAIHEIILALIQGFTEFLPVSGAAHVVLLDQLLGWTASGQQFNLAVNLGVLIAVVMSFRAEINDLILAWVSPGSLDNALGLRRLGLAIAFGSLPVLLVAFLAFDRISSALGDQRVITGSTLLFGWAMLVVDRVVVPSRDLRHLGPTRGLLIGVVQVFALIPGASRTGVAMLMGRMLGFSSEVSARFAYLLSVPVVGAATALGLFRFIGADDPFRLPAFVLTVLVTAVSGWVCIWAFLAALRRFGFLPFILYRMLLGVVLLFVLS